VTSDEGSIVTDAPVAVVTGAGSGIGRDIAAALSKAGYRVALSGRRAQALRETAELTPGMTLTAPADVRSADQVQALFDTTVAQWGRVDLLINNAGAFGPGGPLEDLAAADWTAVIETNLTGSFLCAQAAFRVMKDQDPQGGRIINNGSLSAHVPRPFAVAYTASKHAVTGLTKAISLEGRPYRIACGQIDIGNASTQMTASSPLAVSLLASLGLSRVVGGLAAMTLSDQAACGTGCGALTPRAGFSAGAPVGTIMPQAPSSAPSRNSIPSRRSRSNGPGSDNSPVLSVEKPKRP